MSSRKTDPQHGQSGNGQSGNGRPRNEEEIRQLLRKAGRRPEPPAEDLAAIRATARSAWEEVTRQEQRRRFPAPSRRVLALAASLLLAVLAGWWWLQRERESVAGPTVATVELVDGTVRVGDETLVVGAELRESSELSTEAAGRVAVRMADGQSLRLDTDTAVRFVSRSRLQLVRGAVYIDSPPSVGAERSIDVVTALGTVVEIGTQFEVRIDAAGGVLDVRVREGAVSIRREGRSVTARLGEALTVRRDGSVSRAAIATAAAEWRWVLESAPALEIEGQTLDSFLEWVSRETGWEIVYETAEIREAAATVVLHGTVEGLRPDESIEAILRGSGMGSRVDDATLLISRP